MKQLHQLQAEAAAKRTELDGILSKGDAVSAEELTRAEALAVELEQVQKDITAEQQNGSRLARLREQAGQFDGWAGASPGVPPVAPAPPAGTKFVVPATARRGRVTSFKSDEFGTAHEKAYRFGQFALAALLGRPTARQFCKEQGIALQMLAGGTQLAQVEGVNTQGGYLVPPEFSADLIDLREQYGVFRRNARIEPMGSDTKSRRRRTGGLTAYFVGERATITDSTATFDMVQLVAKKLATLTYMSSEINEDSVIDLGNYLAAEISYAFANKEDECGFNGDGTSTYGGITGVREKIKGLSGTIANIAGLFVGAGNAYSELTIGDFLGVVALLPQYADTPSARWFMHRSFYYAVALREALEAGGVTKEEVINGQRTPIFLGYPVEFAQVLPKTEANSQVCALLGDLRLAADFGDRRQETIALSEHAEFADDELAIRGTQRFDINVHDVGNADSSAANRQPGPIVGLITAAS